MQISTQSSTQKLGIEPAPHMFAKMSTQKIMLIVVLSLIPALAVTCYFFGAGVLIQFAISAVTAIFCQLLSALLRSRSLKRALLDPSGLVTALLLALTLPPLLPWYLTIAAVVFAMLITRECFGGLGMNLFNPAMAGFVFLIISTPAAFFNTWISPTINAISVATPERVYAVIVKGEDPTILGTELHNLSVHNQNIYIEQKRKEVLELTKQHTKEQDNAYVAVYDLNIEQSAIDALSGPTYLERIKTARKAGDVENNSKVDFESPSYIGYLCLGIAYIFGGLILICTKVIRIQMPLAFIGTVAAVSALWNHLDPNMSIGIYEHLLFGGTMLGAFYIVTDPVTTCGTSKGRVIFAMLIAALVVVIRVFGSYSDAVAFAVLLGNCCAPLMDVLTKRRPFGIGYRHGGLD